MNEIYPLTFRDLFESTLEFNKVEKPLTFPLSLDPKVYSYRSRPSFINNNNSRVRILDRTPPPTYTD